MDEINSRLEKLEQRVTEMGSKEKKSTEKRPKEKKSPSAYNMFIGEYLRKHKGEKSHKELFADATAAWKAQKASSDKK